MFCGDAATAPLTNYIAAAQGGQTFSRQVSTVSSLFFSIEDHLQDLVKQLLTRGKEVYIQQTKILQDSHCDPELISKSSHVVDVQVLKA